MFGCRSASCFQIALQIACAEALKWFFKILPSCEVFGPTAVIPQSCKAKVYFRISVDLVALFLSMSASLTFPRTILLHTWQIHLFNRFRQLIDVKQSVLYPILAAISPLSLSERRCLFLTRGMLNDKPHRLFSKEVWGLTPPLTRWALKHKLLPIEHTCTDCQHCWVQLRSMVCKVIKLPKCWSNH